MDNNIYMDKYLEKKDFYLSEKFYNEYGFNASWALDLPMSEMGYKESDWYIPGQLEIYREDSAFKINKMNIIDLYKEQGIDFTEKDISKYTEQLKSTLLRDISNTPKSNVSEKENSKLDKIIVLIYESTDIWKQILGLKYSYFFIREEKELNFFSMVYKKKIIEGSLSELIALISSEKNIVSRFEIYSKWEWS